MEDKGGSAQKQLSLVVYASGELDLDISPQELRKMKKQILSIIQLTEGIWYKHEEIYLKMSLTNTLILLKLILTYRMEITNLIRIFYDLVMCLKVSSLEFKNEILSMVLFLTFSERYTSFANNLICGRNFITLCNMKMGFFQKI